MEYGLYLAIVLVCVAACSVKIWQLGAAKRAEKALSAEDANRPVAPSKAQLGHRSEHQSVPTPWGWPGNVHAAGNGNVHVFESDADHGALHRWVDHLVSEKQTVDDAAYQKKREASMRALLEDRFHSPNHSHAGSHKGRGNADSGVQVEDAPGNPAGTTGQTMPAVSESRPANMPLSLGEPISSVKTPWGW